MATKFKRSKGHFTSYAGLKLFEPVIKAGKLKARLRDFMPTGPRTSSDKNFNKFLAIIYGFIVGIDCIDDMDHVSEDVMFPALCSNKLYSSQNYGKFLGEFSVWQARRIRTELKRYALSLRLKAFPKDRDFIIDLDSTEHKQYGKKMEGVRPTRNWFRSLDSLHAYDQYGFQYYIEVRPGATHTAKGAASVINDLFTGIPRKLNRFFRADAGYCNHGVMTACVKARANFVICASEIIYAPVLKKQNIGWWKWKQTKNTFFRDGRAAESFSFPYHIPGCSKSLRLVMIRARKKKPELFDDQFDYRGFVTDLGPSEMSDEEVVAFYAKRGNAENFIRENKNAFDMQHFPCQKLLKNNIWALISSFAYNTMRFGARALNPKIMHYGKRIRFRMIYLGAHVVKRSRYWIIRLNNYQYEEVKRFECRFQKLLSPG